MSPFLRHIQACNNAILPGRRVPFHLGATPVGYLSPGLADVLAEFPDIGRTAAGVTLNNPAALPNLSAARIRTQLQFETLLGGVGIQRTHHYMDNARAYPFGNCLGNRA